MRVERGLVDRGDSSKPANQVDPGSNPTQGIRLKSGPQIEDKILKYNSWLMARKAEKSTKKKKKK